MVAVATGLRRSSIACGFRLAAKLAATAAASAIAVNVQDRAGERIALASIA